MQNYKTYIDESGNTGDNLTDKNQKYFVLAGVSVPISMEESLKNMIRDFFLSVKEKEETEIKATKWVKTAKKNAVLEKILQEMVAVGCDFSVVVIEKRYMVTSIIVDDFLDGAYNDIQDYTWCNNRDEKIKASQYFYEILDDEDLEFIAKSFTAPTLEGMRMALNKIICKTKDARYLTMLQGCHVEELYEDNLDLLKDTSKMSRGAVRSPNYVAFSALGTLVANHCKRKAYGTEMIFDSCLLCNDAYRYVVELFQGMKSNEIIEQFLGIFPWTNIINNFNVWNSKDMILLQTADIVATSILKTLEKVFNDVQINSYEQFVIDFIKNILTGGGFWYLFGTNNFKKLHNVLT